MRGFVVDELRGGGSRERAAAGCKHVPGREMDNIVMAYLGEDGGLAGI
jgi:hypothetical protein